MNRRRSHNHLQDWEIAIVKAMIQHTDKNNQTILAYFTRPSRSINHRLIGQIRKNVIHKEIASASKTNMEVFMSDYPFIDSDTGLHVYADELLIKAREAMLNAVQTYNNPKTHFRAEIFIVSAVIAWTYLLHAFFKRESIDYLRRDSNGIVETTKHGADRFLGLLECLNKQECTVDDSTKKNLEYLIEIRHEIEHRCTQKIDADIGAKLQACCMNFNQYTKKYFGDMLGLDKDLSFALQFSHISLEQQQSMARETNLPVNVKLAQEKFESNMSYEQYNDQRYAIRVDLSYRRSKNKNTADQFAVLVPTDSPNVNEASQIFTKNAELTKYIPSEVVKEMNKAGFLDFRMHEHSVLKQKFKPQHTPKTNDKGGKYGIWIGKYWFYYQSWLDEIKKYCHENGEGRFSLHP